MFSKLVWDPDFTALLTNPRNPTNSGEKLYSRKGKDSLDHFLRGIGVKNRLCPAALVGNQHPRIVLGGGKQSPWANITRHSWPTMVKGWRRHCEEKEIMVKVRPTFVCNRKQHRSGGGLSRGGGGEGRATA